MEWISVIHKLPKNRQDVIIYDEQSEEIATCQFRCSEDGIEWSEPYYGQDVSFPFAHVSHWMPIPEPPK